MSGSAGGLRPVWGHSRRYCHVRAVVRCTAPAGRCLHDLLAQLQQTGFGRCRSRSIGPDEIPHHPARLAARRHIPEAGRAKRRRRAHIGVEARAGFDRIAFDDLRPLRARITDRRLEEADRHAATTDGGADKEADHRPYRPLVGPWQCAVALESGIAFARRDRTPTDRLLVEIGKNSDWRAGARQPLERFGAAFLGRATELGARHPPAHTGAITKLSVLRYETGQLRRSGGRDLMELKRERRRRHGAATLHQQTPESEAEGTRWRRSVPEA